MPKTPLELLSDCAEAAHAKIQKDFDYINPIVGINRGMRKIGFPADTMTIDCLRTGKRIIIILHDEQPNILSYQLAFRDKDPSDQFESLNLDKLSAELLYQWIAEYFGD